jgi:hypothetical protein
MKRQHIFMALFFTAFMFPFFGNISNANALGSYGCSGPESEQHIVCLRNLLATTPGDSHGEACGSAAQRGYTSYAKSLSSINCLRGLLDQYGAHLQVSTPGSRYEHGYTNNNRSDVGRNLSRAADGETQTLYKSSSPFDDQLMGNHPCTSGPACNTD